MVDESSFGNAGNGILSNQRDPRRGADPPKNESEMTGAIPSVDQSHKSVSTGNGSCIASTILSNSELEKFQRSIRDTRSLSSSAAMTLSTPSTPSMTIGNSGQISSISLTDRVSEQRSCRS